MGVNSDQEGIVEESTGEIFYKGSTCQNIDCIFPSPGLETHAVNYHRFTRTVLIETEVLGQQCVGRNCVPFIWNV